MFGLFENYSWSCGVIGGSSRVTLYILPIVLDVLFKTLAECIIRHKQKVMAKRFIPDKAQTASVLNVLKKRPIL